MLGIKHIKFDSMTYVIHYRNGKILREGRGLSFFYFSPNSSIVAIPIGSNDLPFIFSEITSDFQTINIQGQITYKVGNPKLLSEILDFTVNDNGQYKKNDLEKLNQRIINEAQTSITSYVRELKLIDAICSAPLIENHIMNGLKNNPSISMLGIDILGVAILGVHPTPEMARALETVTREKLQQEADQAIYERRIFAVEQERKIKESELNTEIAIEEKQKQIVQKKLETQLQELENDRKLKEFELETNITIEQNRSKLIDLKSINDKKDAEAKSYAIETLLKPYKEIDWKILTALSSNSDPRVNISLAFRELANNAEKIKNLNISPDLLNSLLNDFKDNEEI
jgi:hypothetical protein